MDGLDGIKLLSLSHSNQRFDVVDAVCRDLAVNKLLTAKLLPTPPLPLPPPQQPDVAALVSGNIPVHNVAYATTPFLAMVQYNCLEDDAQLVYGLIQSVINGEKRKGSDVNEEEVIAGIGSEIDKTTIFPTGRFVESNQLTKLEELSHFRRQLMATVPLPVPERANNEADDDLLLASLDSVMSMSTRQVLGQGQRQGLRGTPKIRPLR